MNIFYVDEDARAAARALCDRHVIKMVLETAQIMSTVCHKWGVHGVPYRATHVNHPSVLWAGASSQHYDWMFRHGAELSVEFTRRYRKAHASSVVIFQLEKAPMPDSGWEPPPQAMPNRFKKPDTVEAYRQYYREGKAHLLSYKLNNQPEWL